MRKRLQSHVDPPRFITGYARNEPETFDIGTGPRPAVAGSHTKDRIRLPVSLRFTKANFYFGPLLTCSDVGAAFGASESRGVIKRSAFAPSRARQASTSTLADIDRVIPKIAEVKNEAAADLVAKLLRRRNDFAKPQKTNDGRWVQSLAVSGQPRSRD